MFDYLQALLPTKPRKLAMLSHPRAMHGVSRDEPAKATVRWVPGEGVKVQAQFKVNLTNYKVSVPSIVRLKVSDEIALNVMLKVKTR